MAAWETRPAPRIEERDAPFFSSGAFRIGKGIAIFSLCWEWKRFRMDALIPRISPESDASNGKNGMLLRIFQQKTDNYSLLFAAFSDIIAE